MRRHRITKKYAAQFIEMLKKDIETEAFTPNEKTRKFPGEMQLYHSLCRPMQLYHSCPHHSLPISFHCRYLLLILMCKTVSDPGGGCGEDRGSHATIYGIANTTEILRPLDVGGRPERPPTTSKKQKG